MTKLLLVDLCHSLTYISDIIDIDQFSSKYWNLDVYLQ